MNDVAGCSCCGEEITEGYELLDDLDVLCRDCMLDLLKHRFCKRMSSNGEGTALYKIGDFVYEDDSEGHFDSILLQTYAFPVKI